MYIRKINSVSSAQSNNAIKFQGLWGNTLKVNNQTKNTYCKHIYNYETKEYHPFADECLEDLSNIQKKNSTYKTISNEFDNNCVIHSGTNILIKPYLLFTTKQWIAYISNKLIKESPEVKLIEKNLKQLHLERYLRA